MRVTASTITPEQIVELRSALLVVKRKNARVRALIADCCGAMTGSQVCREAVADEWNLRAAAPDLWNPKRGGVSIELPADLVAAIEAYNATDWSDGRDPSKFGALNAVAFIGERVATLYKNRSGS